MNKIILILVCSLTILGCSTDEETNNTNPELQSKIIGTWKNDGHYEDTPNPNPVPFEAEHFYPISNGVKITYYTSTYSSSYLDEPIINGNYSITKDSILAHNDEIIGKIYRVNDTILLITHPSGYAAIRYRKL